MSKIIQLANPYLDLHLALFSAHSSFPLDLRSFWLFTLTWTRKRALVFWPTGIYAFFPGIYAYFPGNYAHNFSFKMHKVQKCQKWCNYARVGENRSKSRNLSNEHLFVFLCFFSRIQVCIHMRHCHCSYINGNLIDDKLASIQDQSYHCHVLLAFARLLQPSSFSKPGW